MTLRKTLMGAVAGAAGDVAQPVLGRVGGEQRLFGPLINIMPFDRPQTFGDCPARTLSLSAGPVEDLTLEVHLGANGVPLLDYDANPACYSQAQVRSLQEELFSLLAAWLQAPQQSRDQLLSAWSAQYRAQHLLTAPASEQTAMAEVGSLLHAIRAQAERQPQHLALCQGERQVVAGDPIHGVPLHDFGPRLLGSGVVALTVGRGGIGGRGSGRRGR